MKEICKRDNSQEKETIKKLQKRNKSLGYAFLYLFVLCIIIIGEVIIFYNNPNASLWQLFQDTIGNLMGVMAAFLIFDIAHEKISKDTYATEVSEQILETMLYHPEVINLYENDQKKVLVKSFVSSVVDDDEDVIDMFDNFFDNYLLTKKDFNLETIKPSDCRVRTAFSYRFVLETGFPNAFSLIHNSTDDDYFYVQEELNYTVKFLSDKGKNFNENKMMYGLIFEQKHLDKVFRERENYFDKCIFRETLDIKDCHKEELFKYADKPEMILSMFRPYLAIDGYKSKNVEVRFIKDKDVALGLIFVFTIDYDVNKTSHDVDIIFHMPKRWNSVLQVCIVEPSKAPKISMSYDEDAMDIEMYPFLNKGDSSSYDNSLEEQNGVFSINISDEWVFPMSGVTFFVKKINSLT